MVEIDKKELLAKLTLDDVKKIFESFDEYDYSEEYEGDKLFAIRFPTVCHGGDSKKLYYYAESKLFHCYTQCQETFNIYSLVMRVLDIEFHDALTYIAELLGYEGGYKKIGFAEKDKIDDWDIINKYTKIKHKREVPEIKIHPQQMPNLFVDYYYAGWLKEYITIDTMKKYNIKLDTYNQKIVIPHYNSNGDLIGIRGRALKQEDIEGGRKYMPLTIQGVTYKHQTKYSLFGLNHNWRAIEKIKKVMLVEAEKSVMQSDSYYGDNSFVVGTSGSVISNYQRDLILKLGVSEVILAFDKEYRNEKELEKYLSKMYRIACKFINFCDVYVLLDEEDLLDYKDSPTDKGREVLEALMKKKVKFEVNTYEI